MGPKLLVNSSSAAALPPCLDASAASQVSEIARVSCFATGLSEPHAGLVPVCKFDSCPSRCRSRASSSAPPRHPGIAAPSAPESPRPLGLSQTHARAATIFVDELNSCTFQGIPNSFDGFVRNLTPRPFVINNSRKSKPRFLRKFRLRHFQESARASTLSRVI